MPRADLGLIAADALLQFVATRNPVPPTAARFRAELYGLHAYEPSVPRKYHALGSVDDCAAKIREYVDAGATTILIQPECPFPQLEDQLAAISEAVVPPPACSRRSRPRPPHPEEIPWPSGAFNLFSLGDLALRRIVQRRCDAYRGALLGVVAAADSAIEPTGVRIDGDRVPARGPSACGAG